MTDITLTEFSEKIGRMCREYGRYGTCESESCPLFDYHCSPLDGAFLANIDEVVSIVCKWDEEHPKNRYTVRLMRYFDIEVAANDEDEAISIAEHRSENLDFNDGDGDCDVWRTNI